MKVLDLLGATIAAVLPKARPSLDEEQLHELERRARLNGLAATRRAERAATFDALLSETPRWVPRRVGFLSSRPRERW